MNKRREQFGPWTTYERENVRIKTRTENVGWGFTHYVLTGSREAITAEMESICRAWPPQGYSTICYWPPEAEISNPEYRPVEISPGIWEAKVWRANSCD